MRLRLGLNQLYSVRILPCQIVVSALLELDRKALELHEITNDHNLRRKCKQHVHVTTPCRAEPQLHMTEKHEICS